MSVKSTVYIQKEENWYVATSIETGVASQGKTIDEAIAKKKILEKGRVYVMKR